MKHWIEFKLNKESEIDILYMERAACYFYIRNPWDEFMFRPIAKCPEQYEILGDISRYADIGERHTEDNFIRFIYSPEYGEHEKKVLDFILTFIVSAPAVLKTYLPAAYTATNGQKSCAEILCPFIHYPKVLDDIYNNKLDMSVIIYIMHSIKTVEFQS